MRTLNGKTTKSLFGTVAALVVLACVTLFLSAAPSSANPAPVSFKSPVTYSPGAICPRATAPAPVNALVVASADMNGDGRTDLVVGNRSSTVGKFSCISVMLGKANGALAPAKLYTTAGKCAPSDPKQPKFNSNLNVPLTVSTADLNSDGKADVVTGSDGDNCVGVFLNTTPRGAAAVTFAAGSPRLYGTCDNYSQPGWISTANMDRDRDIDITVISGNEGVKQAKASVMVNQGNATFNPTICKAPYAGKNTGVGLTGIGYPQNLINADLNGDGLKDIATLTYVSGLAQPLSVMLNRTNAPGTFLPAQLLGWTNAGGGIGYDSGAALAAGDINNDGRQDLIVGQMGVNFVVLLINETPSAGAKAVFRQAARIHVDSAQTVRIADMNGDGNADIVTTSPEVLLGRGNGTFAPAQSFSIGNSGYATTAKLTSGLPSIVAIDFEKNRLHVLVNTTPVPPAPPKHKQTAQLKCGPPVKIKRIGLTPLLCPTFTNIGQPVGVGIAGFLRGDVVLFRKVIAPNGVVYIRTYGYPLNLRVTYSAPGTATFNPYVRVVRYVT